MSVQKKPTKGYPSREITDNSVNMLVAGFQRYPDLWSFRISMVLNIEICIKKLTFYLMPDLVSSNSKSSMFLISRFKINRGLSKQVRVINSFA